jgi:hypothetical protein
MKNTFNDYFNRFDMVVQVQRRRKSKKKSQNESELAVNVNDKRIDQ